MVNSMGIGREWTPQVKAVPEYIIDLESTGKLSEFY